MSFLGSSVFVTMRSHGSKHMFRANYNLEIHNFRIYVVKEYSWPLLNKQDKGARNINSPKFYRCFQKHEFTGERYYKNYTSIEIALGKYYKPPKLYVPLTSNSLP